MGRTKTANRRRPRVPIQKAVTGGATALTLSAAPIQRPFGLLEALNAATNHGMPPGDYRPMPRDPQDLGAFGPGQPIQPEPIDPLDPRTGRPEPRVWEYPMSWNLPGNNRREVPWQVLRAAAAGVGLIRRCIEVRKAHVADLQWSWSVRATVVEKAYNSSRDKGYDAIAAELREQHQAEIERLTARWEQPWPHQDWTFDQWIRSMLEELLVIDAGVIYPRMSLAGEILDLEQVDGSTIKPLLDHRGIRPAPPFPAYQQEVWGFPRGEWAASTTLDAEGNVVIDNGYAASEMFYFRANPRVTSPYGLSPVEQALIDSRLYLKRMNWMLAEYDDGSTPLTVWEVPENPGAEMTPAQRRIWEESVNAEYGGQTAARHRMKVGMPGWQIKQLSSADERYKPDFDLHLIKLVAGYFGVTATELGFSETTGLGSAGWQEGQAEVGGRVGLRPDVKALTGLINGVSRQFLNAPPEIEFSFIDPASENDKDSDAVADAQVKRGTIVLNDDRRRLKLPLYSFPEADMPMLVGVGPAGYVFLDGAKQAADDAAAAAVKAQEATAEGATGKLELEQAKIEDGKEARHEEQDLQRETRDAEHDFQREQAKTTTKAASADDVAAELAAFRTWHKRHGDRPSRPFVFKVATPEDLTGLVPGPAVATFLAKATTEDGGAGPKAPDERWPGWEQDLAIAAAGAAAMAAALAAGVASGAAMVVLAGAFREWAQAWTPGSPDPDIIGWLRATTTLGPDVEAAIRPVIEDIWAEGYFVGTRAAGAVVDNLAAGVPPREAISVDVDWAGWTPGDVSAARRIMAEDGSIEPFRQLLRDAGITIKGIADNRLEEVARCLADGLKRGASVDEIARDLQRTVADPKWCYKTAVTETTRALSAASLDTYEQAGIGATEWLDANDARVCKICRINAAAGPVRIGERYPSGDYHPPAHPHDRCALVPALLDDLLKAANMDWRAWNRLYPKKQRDARGRWARGNGASLAAARPFEAFDWLTDGDDDGPILEPEPEAMGPRRLGPDDAAWEARIASGVTNRRVLSTDDNTSHVELVTFGNGSRAVYKTDHGNGSSIKDDLDAEELVAPIARLLGLSPPDVYRDSDDAAYFTYVDDAVLAIELIPDDAYDISSLQAHIDGTDGRRMGLLDVLIDNGDRNLGNWFTRTNGSVVPIDHGQGWNLKRSNWLDPDEVSGDQPPFLHDFDRPYVQLTDWKENDLSPEWLESLRPKLEAMRREFARLGREDWLEYTLQRLDALKAHAKGTVTL